MGIKYDNLTYGTYIFNQLQKKEEVLKLDVCFYFFCLLFD